MPSITFESHEDGIDLKLEFTSLVPEIGISDSHLYTQAITSLLESADTDFWEKSENEMDPVDFYGEILAAIVKHYARSIPEISVGMKSYDVLEGLLRDVKDAGYLQGDVSQFESDDRDEID